MKIRVLASACNYLLNGHRFYEAQGEGLGDYFLDSLFAEIDSLRIYAGIHQRTDAGYYRLLVRRFPFAIYYRLKDDQVLVYAVLDCRRRPAWHRNRLKGH